MRRLIACALAATATTVAVAACASVGTPPGGPERHVPPVLLKVTPDSGATNVHLDDATFEFDEVVSEKPARGNLDQVFLVSPRDGDPRVGWHRSRITVRPRHGFKPNTAYTITMTPGMSDIRGNIMKEGRQIVFSTGPTIPTLGIVGHAFDWATEQPAANALVMAIRHPDSTVFITLADSTGAFDIGPFGPGSYTLVGLLDQNANFQIDRLEKWDSVRVDVTDHRPIAELLLIARDSIAPTLSSASPQDSLTVVLTFDRAVRAGPAGYGRFFVTRADSTHVTIDSVIAQPEYQRREQARRARADTAKADTARTAAAAAESLATRRVKTPLSKPSVPAPPTGLVLLLSPRTPLTPGATYRVTAADVTGMGGTRGTTSRTMTVPKPAPKDTSRRAPADTTRRPAAAPVRPPR